MENEYSHQYFLFSSTKAAQKVAFALRGNWDGCNGIELTKQIDNAALNLAAILCNAEYCQAGKACNMKSDLASSGGRSHRSSDAEDNEYRQMVLEVFNSMIAERSMSKIVLIGQKPEHFFSGK